MKSIIKSYLALLLCWIATSCGENDQVRFRGKYVGDFDVGGGTYRTTFTFTDSSFTKEFFFVDEDELVWKCTGTYTLGTSKLLRTKRVCEFLRSEEPTPPEGLADVASTVKDITDTSFVLCFEEDDNSVPDTAICVRFVKSSQGKLNE